MSQEEQEPGGARRSQEEPGGAWEVKTSCIEKVIEGVMGLSGKLRSSSKSSLSLAHGL